MAKKFRNIWLLSLMIFISQSSQMAFGCKALQDPIQLQKTIDKAAFAGIVQITGTRKVSEDGYEIWLRPIETFKGSLPGEVYIPPLKIWSTCNPSYVREGDVIEEMIFLENGHYRRADHLEFYSGKPWLDLRNHTPDSPQLKSLVEKCERRDGAWIDYERRMFCRFPGD